MSESDLIESFPALTAVAGLTHGFLLRSPGIEVDCDREEVLARLAPYHGDLLKRLGISCAHLATGEQVHGAEIAVLSEVPPRQVHFPDTDSLVTCVSGQYLGVWVADCGAVFLVDPVHRACGIVHSGRVGTEKGIAPAAIRTMSDAFGTKPEDLIIQLAPCIRPPAYEVDFVARILDDCFQAGVPKEQIHDCGTCTTSRPDRYYSYRQEKGRTGRLFAVIGWTEA